MDTLQDARRELQETLTDVGETCHARMEAR